MIVGGGWFQGEDSIAAQWEQHDMYGRALAIIAGGCQQHRASAAAMLGLPPPLWVETFDHRTLQQAHDLLAAVWRFRNDAAQPRLPGLGAKEALPWLEWLRAEVASWHQTPEIVRLVGEILAQPNCPAGYAAEDRLAEQLQARYADVPWIARS